MKLVKESVTKTYSDTDIVVETVKQFYYHSLLERNNHSKEMQNDGYKDSGQERKNIGSVQNPEYVWFGNYYKSKTIKKS